MKPSPQTIASIMRTLKRRYPAKGMVDMGSAEDTLLATLLSAQSTDVQVLKAYPGFRKAFSTWDKLAKADVRAIEKTINSIGLYHAKAKAIKGLAQKILADFNGKVPRTMKELTSLPGVGRKTASCVLWYAYGIPAMAVDTHVLRIARRLGWAKGKTPEQVERELCANIPDKYWGDINRTMVQFGRDVCKAGRPQCWRCPIAALCPYTPKTPAPKG